MLTSTIIFTLLQLSSIAFAHGNQNRKRKGSKGGTGGNGGVDNSLTLEAGLVQSNSKQDGFNASAPQQARSITSDDNFINFCKGKTLTNGQQVKTGSCNGIVMGNIPSTDNMVAAKFKSPFNTETIQSNTTFNIELQIANLQTGVFTNAATNYYAAPQQLNNQGQIIGHTHVVINEISSIDSTEVVDALNFVFFKGVDNADVNGVATVTVTGGVGPGTYRLCSINTSANHTPVLMPVAQHNSNDDCIYFTASANGGNGGGNGGSKKKGGNKGQQKNVQGQGGQGQGGQGQGKRQGGRQGGRRRSESANRVES